MPSAVSWKSVSWITPEGPDQRELMAERLLAERVLEERVLEEPASGPRRVAPESALARRRNSSCYPAGRHGAPTRRGRAAPSPHLPGGKKVWEVAAAPELTA